MNKIHLSKGLCLNSIHWGLKLEVIDIINLYYSRMRRDCHNANSRDLSLQDRYKSYNASVLINFHLFYRLCGDGDSVCINRVCNKDHKGLYCAGYKPYIRSDSSSGPPLSAV